MLGQAELINQFYDIANIQRSVRKTTRIKMRKK